MSVYKHLSTLTHARLNLSIFFLCYNDLFCLRIFRVFTSNFIYLLFFSNSQLSHKKCDVCACAVNAAKRKKEKQQQQQY